MTYDLIHDIKNWKPTGAFYSRQNPNKSWWQWWKPDRIKMEILEKLQDDWVLRVGYFNDGSNIVSETISEQPIDVSNN